MRIGIDLDGCVYSFTDSLRAWLVDNGYPAAQVASRETCWEFYEVDWGMSLGDFLAECRRAADAGWLFSHGLPLPDSAETMWALADAGHELHIVTDRAFGTTPHASRLNTLRWLHDYGIPFDSLTFSADKTAVLCDMFLDDRPRNVDALVAVGCDAWLLDNGRTDQAGHGRLIPSWAEFRALAESTERAR